MPEDCKTIAIDLDGTLVERRWPELGEWKPGAVEAVRELLDQGHKVFVFSSRLNPTWMEGVLKQPAVRYAQIQEVRTMLDNAGLQEVTIWDGEKPYWHVLVDDRCLWFPGRSRSWRLMLPKILARAGMKHERSD